MGMANSTGNPPESYPAEHFIGKPGCQCEPCRAWFDGWNAGYMAGQRDAVEDRKGVRTLIQQVAGDSTETQ